MRLGAVLSLAWFAVTGFSMPLVPLGMPTDQATPQQSSRQDAEESQQQLRQSQLSLDAGIGSNVVAGGVGLLGGSAVTFLTTKGKYYNLGGRVATRIYDEWQRKLGECYVKQATRARKESLNPADAMSECDKRYPRPKELGEPYKQEESASDSHEETQQPSQQQQERKLTSTDEDASPPHFFKSTLRDLPRKIFRKGKSALETTATALMRATSSASASSSTNPRLIPTAGGGGTRSIIPGNLRFSSL